MLYDITEISTEEKTGLTYVLVSFFDNEADRQAGRVRLRNEFLMQIATQETRIVRDEEGRFKLSTGEFLSGDEIQIRMDKGEEIEFERETVAFNPKQAIIDNIELYAATAEARNWSGDHTADSTKPFYVDGVQVKQNHSEPMKRTSADPKGVLSHPDVAALVTAVASDGPADAEAKH